MKVSSIKLVNLPKLKNDSKVTSLALRIQRKKFPVYIQLDKFKKKKDIDKLNRRLTCHYCLEGAIDTSYIHENSCQRE